ncbi:MAG: aminopeptidase P family protein [Deltaproteobacteria bacterium]|nr:aminopeptidase P family protein [Deltaproteobacteria bacterium]
MTQLYKNRRDQLTQRAVAAGMDTLMICAPVNLLYFTGIKMTPYERFIALLMDIRSGQAQLILPSLERDAAKDSGITAKFYGDHDDPFLFVIDFLGTCRLVGVEKSSLPLFTAEKILTGLNHKPGQAITAFADITGMISGIRLLKDDTELKYLCLAAGYSDEILAGVSAKIHVGQTEKSITIEIMRAMAAQPELLINEFVIQVLVGKGSADPHGYASDRTVKEGDPITIDFGVCYQQYWSDCTRTFFMGPPKQQFKEIYQIVLEAQQEAIAKVRPGVPMAEVDLTARKVIGRAGYGEYFIHRIGHGIGLSIHESPSIHSQNLIPLAERMVATIEPGIYLPGLGGIRIEDDVVVTADGVEVMTHHPKSYADMVL